MAPTPIPDRRLRFVKLIAAALSEAQAAQATQAQQAHRRRQLRRIIHPGGYLAASRHIEQLLSGSPKQFYELFR
ncbi:uncharacterized protein PG998_014379 [Apiospora kogelbergensis]|uniref:uncharacterized protein n=1 Tax=Apiospora kogelbergensis TaxID=1337665 RepID=UPI00312F191E